MVIILAPITGVVRCCTGLERQGGKGRRVGGGVMGGGGENCCNCSV